MDYPYIVFWNMQEHHFETIKEAIDFSMKVTKGESCNKALIFCRHDKKDGHYRISEVYVIDFVDLDIYMIENIEI